MYMYISILHTHDQQNIIYIHVKIYAAWNCLEMGIAAFKGSTQWQNNALLHPRTHCL